jgi:outer membrane protein assembly factor BamA
MRPLPLIIYSVFLLLFLYTSSYYPQDTTDTMDIADWDAFPIFNYDSNTGFGYGGKVFFYNYLSSNESFDLILYNSTKGERWYKFVFSSRDIERRQGKEYPFALDLIVDYDKLIYYNFYSKEHSNNADSLKEFETFTKEPFEVSVNLNRTFTNKIIIRAGLKYSTISSYNFESGSVLMEAQPEYNNTFIRYLSVLFNVRWDTRNSFINPNRGFVAQLESEFAPDILFTNEDFLKQTVTLQSYFTLFNSGIILASRIIGQIIFPDTAPFQLKPAIGGNSTVRGLPQDRYISSSTVVANAELRFSIWWRFSGIAGFDLGAALSKNNYTIMKDELSGWKFNPVAGLRFALDNFIVRFDLGIGQDYTGMYFNFGHMF